MNPRVAALLLAVIVPALAPQALAAVPGVEEGDLFVGSGPPAGDPNITTIPRIYRVLRRRRPTFCAWAREPDRRGVLRCSAASAR